ncbi:MAG: DUF7139 domain-containing protein [Halodesulfurarchaeum sp.]
MPSLGETYERRVGVASRRQVLLGTGLFVTGAIFLAAGIFFAGTGVMLGLGFSVFEAREIAGILAGLGLPAVFVGTTIVLPATRLHYAVAAFGAGLAVVGVGVFRVVYPENWYGAPGVPSQAVLLLALVYATGILLTLWSVFTAVATFKTRNDPGGTVRLSVGGRAGERAVKAVQTEFQQASEAISAGLGGIGTFGEETDTPDLGPQPHRSPGSVSDGGASVDADIIDPEAGPGPSAEGQSADLSGEAGEPSGLSASDDAEVLGAPTVEPDHYCGNCAQFEYVDRDGEMTPFCRRYDERMDDMEACQWWEPQ